MKKLFFLVFIETDKKSRTKTYPAAKSCGDQKRMQKLCEQNGKVSKRSEGW